MSELSSSRIAAHYAASTERFTQVSLAIDPTLTFSVNGTTDACNGITPTETATSSSINFGSLTTGTRSAAQQFNITTNAQSGFVLSIKSPQALQSSTHTFSTVSGTNAQPETFKRGEAFGYTTDSLARFTSTKFAKLISTNETIVSSSGPSTNTRCVAYQANVGPSTPAGIYTGSVVYSVVPSY